MAVHKELLSRVERRLREDAQPLSKEIADDRQLVVAFALHCADLCNPVLPPDMSRRIAERLGEEFDAQAEQERGQGLQVTVMLAPNISKKGAATEEKRPLCAAPPLLHKGSREPCRRHASLPH